MPASGKPALLAVVGDGCAKATRYQSSGSASSFQQQVLSKFVQPADLAAAASHEAVADSPAAGVPCTASTYCAREKATAGCHLLDVHGVTGFVCPHGAPVRRGMVMQKEPECYARYRQGLAPVAEERNLQAFSSESACQMEQSMKGHMPELLSGTSFRTGQMHGSTHVTPCQLQHHLALAEGYGDIIGEQTEQLWATLKAARRPLRCECVTCHSSAQCMHRPIRHFCCLGAWYRALSDVLECAGLHCRLDHQDGDDTQQAVGIPAHVSCRIFSCF